MKSSHQVLHKTISWTNVRDHGEFAWFLSIVVGLFDWYSWEEFTFNFGDSTIRVPLFASWPVRPLECFPFLMSSILRFIKWSMFWTGYGEEFRELLAKLETFISILEIDFRFKFFGGIGSVILICVCICVLSVLSEDNRESYVIETVVEKPHVVHQTKNTENTVIRHENHCYHAVPNTNTRSITPGNTAVSSEITRDNDIGCTTPCTNFVNNIVRDDNARNITPSNTALLSDIARYNDIGGTSHSKTVVNDIVRDNSARNTIPSNTAIRRHGGRSNRARNRRRRNNNRGRNNNRDRNAASRITPVPQPPASLEAPARTTSIPQTPASLPPNPNFNFASLVHYSGFGGYEYDDEETTNPGQFAADLRPYLDAYTPANNHYTYEDEALPENTYSLYDDFDDFEAPQEAEDPPPQYSSTVTPSESVLERAAPPETPPDYGPPPNRSTISINGMSVTPGDFSSPNSEASPSLEMAANSQNEAVDNSGHRCTSCHGTGRLVETTESNNNGRPRRNNRNRNRNQNRSQNQNQNENQHQDQTQNRTQNRTPNRRRNNRGRNSRNTPAANASRHSETGLPVY